MTCVKWGGTGLIYTSSQDRTIKVFYTILHFLNFSNAENYNFSYIQYCFLRCGEQKMEFFAGH